MYYTKYYIYNKLYNIYYKYNIKNTYNRYVQVSWCNLSFCVFFNDCRGFFLMNFTVPFNGTVKKMPPKILAYLYYTPIKILSS